MEYTSSRRVALAGFVFAFPAIFLVTAGVLQLGFGLESLVESVFGHPLGQILVHPIVIFGGLLLGIALNAVPVFRIRFESYNGIVATTIVTHLRPGNLGALVLNGVLLTLLLLYAFGENFMIVAR